MSSAPSKAEATRIFRETNPGDFADAMPTGASEARRWLCAVIDAAKAEYDDLQSQMMKAETDNALIEARVEELSKAAQAAMDQRDQALLAKERLDGRTEGLQIAVNLLAAQLRDAGLPGEPA